MGELSNTTINGVSYDFKDAGAARQSHSHTKSQITDFPTSMPASDVSAWAKASSKPSYTASEVGAVPTTRTVNSRSLNDNIELTGADIFVDATSEHLVSELLTAMADKLKIKSAKCKPLSKTWTTKTWSGLTSFNAAGIWTDGANIYYSVGTDQYVLNGSTWTTKTWSGLTSFNAAGIWTDGANIYYSADTEQYVLNGSTWTTKTWSGLTSFNGAGIWTDGANIYYSHHTDQYVLDKATSTWSAKTWTGLTDLVGYSIWTDGTNIYYYDNTTQFVLSGSTWTETSGPAVRSYAKYVWTDGTNIYYSDRTTEQYVLDKATSTWVRKTWTGLTNFRGDNIWTDGTNIYYSDRTTQFVLTDLKSVR